MSKFCIGDTVRVTRREGFLKGWVTETLRLVRESTKAGLWYTETVEGYPGPWVHENDMEKT